jgi:short-subunit dehydrogenase
LIDGFGIKNADSPENVAKHIVQGIEEGKEYIFPDVMSHQMGAKYLSSPQEIEQIFSHF